MTNLQTLIIKGDRFFGSLSDAFLSLPNLRSVLIHFTELTGAIPESLLRATTVSLSNNRFTSFPASFADNCTVSSLTAVNNSLAAASLALLAPCRFLVTIELGSNQLGPVVPASILALPRLLNLVLNLNNFSLLELPTSPSSSLFPSQVDLTSNNFTGPISDDMLKTMIRFGGSWYARDKIFCCCSNQVGPMSFPSYSLPSQDPY
jgi:hypothetical protein